MTRAGAVFCTVVKTDEKTKTKITEPVNAQQDGARDNCTENEPR